MKLSTYINVIFCCVIIINSACKNQTEKNQSTTESLSSDEVELSQHSANLIELSLVKIKNNNLGGIIQVNGLLDVPPQNMVTIAAPMGGFVKHTDMLQGMRVKKGDVIAEMQHQQYIEMQQEFLDSKTQLTYLTLEYQRQVVLSKEQVNSEKNLQFAKAQYESMLAKNSALTSKLKLIGIDASKLTAHNIEPTIKLYAPIDGYITEVNINQGMYVNQTDVLVKIVNTSHLHAELTVFEKDIPNVKIGQKIRFILANENVEREATVYLIGKEIGKDRTIRIHGHLNQEDLNLIPGMYLKAYIETQPEHLPTLPSQAIVHYQGQEFVFVSTSKANTYKMIQVKKGISLNGFTAIKLNDELTAETNVVANGAYDLLAKLKNGEEEE